MDTLHRVATLQMNTSFNVERNVAHIKSSLQSIPAETIVVTPEGAISGYSECADDFQRYQSREIQNGIRALFEYATLKNIHLFTASALKEHSVWYNTGLYLGPAADSPIIYKKINLSTNDRTFFTPGRSQIVIELPLEKRKIKVGFILCREIRYPEQWRMLAERGVDLFAYLNNATGDSAIFPIWKSHLISRAAETQRFIVGVNNAAPYQKCPTIIIDPFGNTLYEEDSYHENLHVEELAFSTLKTSVLEQSAYTIKATLKG